MGAERCRKLLTTEPNLAVIFYLPTKDPGKYQRVALRSSSYSIPAGSIVQIDQ